MAEVEAELGPIDVLVNNAGITRDGMLHKMTPQQWNEVIRVNLASVFNMTRHVIEGMRERGCGRIINISSINGQKGQIGQTNYSAAKAGMIGFTKALAQENANKGITVNAIAPGYIDTEMVAPVPQNVLDGIIADIPVGRLGKAEEIADMRRLPRRRGRRLHHRRDAQPERRAVPGLRLRAEIRLEAPAAKNPPRSPAKM